MTDTLLTCPRCAFEMPLSEALTARLHAQFDVDHQAGLQNAVREAVQRAQADVDARLATAQLQVSQQTEKVRLAETREIELRRKTLELEQSQAQAVEKIGLELETKIRREADTRTQALGAAGEQRAGMYGEMRGLIGQTMPSIAGLELESVALLGGGS